MNALILAKMQTFEPDSLKTSGDIAPQNQRILNDYIFGRFERITFKLGKIPNFKALFPAMTMDFR